MMEHAGGDSSLVDHVFIICAGLLVFSPGWFNFFVSDDFDWILRGASLTSGNFGHSFEILSYNIFRPLVPVWFFALHQLFGLSPFGYHLSSITLHILHGLLLYHIILHFSPHKDIALMSALIFVSHFAHEETVFWISSNCVLTSWFFALSSILVFLRWLKKGKIWLVFLSLGLGLIAFFFREDALALPFILTVIIWLKKPGSKKEVEIGFDHKTRTKTLITLLPFFLMVAIYLYLRRLGLPHLRFGDLLSFDPVNLIRNFAYFLGNLIFPLRLFFDALGYHYSRAINSAVNGIDSGLLMVLASFLVIIFSLLVVFVWLRKANQDLKRFTVLFIILLLPGLFTKGYGLRFTYAPLLGFAPLAAYFLSEWVQRTNRRRLRSEKSYVYVVLIVILILNFLILGERHRWWAKASRMCEETINQAGTAIRTLPSGSKVCFIDLPTRINGAYIFNQGFVEAMTLFHPDGKHEITTLKSEDLPELKGEELRNCYGFKYEDGEFFRVF